MVFLRKYAVTLDGSTAGSLKLRVPIRKASSNDFATSSDFTVATGDFQVSKDGGAFANIGTNPSYTNGLWEITLSGTELTCKHIQIRLVDSATKAVDDDYWCVETYGNASAMYPANYAGGGAGNILTSGTGTDQLNVSGGRADANALYWNGSAVPTPDTAGYPKVTLKGGTGAGEISLSSGLVTLAGTQAFNNTGTWTGNLSGSVGSVTGAVGSVTGNVGGNVAGSVGSVTAAVTVGTNNDKTGYRLSAAGVDDVWDEATSGHAVAGSFGVWVLGLLADAAFVAPDNQAIADTYSYLQGLAKDVNGHFLVDVWGVSGDSAAADNLERWFDGTVGFGTSGSVVTGSLSGSVGDVTTKTGYKLASDGLDSISVTAPSGVASTFPAMLVQLFRRFFKKSTLTATQLKTYADDGTTVVTTQTVSDDGTTQTQGAAS